MIMAVVGLVDAMFTLIATNNVAYGIAAAALPAFLLWYTSREDIREAFAAADEAANVDNIKGMYPAIVRTRRRPGARPGLRDSKGADR